MSTQSIQKKIAELSKQALLEHKTTNVADEERKIKEIIKKITALLKQKKITAKVQLGGSAAKQVYLGDDFDVDIFVIFDTKKYQNSDISDLLEKVLKTLKPVRVHGSRDYFQIDKRYEIIPVLKIQAGKVPVNVTDASPLHVDWVQKKFKQRKSLANDIKTAKIFFKACGVYGAESYIKGISGHVTDILVIHYSSFFKMLQAIAQWKDTTEIDVEKHKSVIDKAKLFGPLLIIDPIQPNRNASAAVSKEQYEKLKTAAKLFLKKPSLEMLRIPPINAELLCKKYDCVLAAEPKTGKTDIVGAKLMKGYEQICAALTPFEIVAKTWQWDKKNTAYYCFTLKNKQLSSTMERIGPTNEFPEHVAVFKKKYPNANLKNGKMIALVPRKILTPEQAITQVMQDTYFNQRVKNLKTLKI